MTKRILFIDDEKDIQAVARLGLTMQAGWDVITANSGEEGIAQAEVQQPDAILLDVMMPDMDGLATLKQLQANPKVQQIPVVFLTAKAQTTDRYTFLEAGAMGVITKPFDTLTLADQVAEILGWSV